MAESVRATGRLGQEVARDCSGVRSRFCASSVAARVGWVKSSVALPVRLALAMLRWMPVAVAAVPEVVRLALPEVSGAARLSWPARALVPLRLPEKLSVTAPLLVVMESGAVPVRAAAPRAAVRLRL